MSDEEIVREERRREAALRDKLERARSIYLRESALEGLSVPAPWGEA